MKKRKIRYYLEKIDWRLARIEALLEGQGGVVYPEIHDLIQNIGSVTMPECAPDEIEEDAAVSMTPVVAQDNQAKCNCHESEMLGRALGCPVHTKAAATDIDEKP